MIYTEMWIGKNKKLIDQNFYKFYLSYIDLYNSNSYMGKEKYKNSSWMILLVCILYIHMH